MTVIAAVVMHVLSSQPAQSFGLPLLNIKLYSIPAGSMAPTLLIGDYVIGFTISEPKRGDVVTYRMPKDPSTIYVKRIVGLAGDRVQMIGGALHVNGAPAKRERVEDNHKVGPGGATVEGKSWREILPNGASYTTIDLVENGFYDNTPLFTVPAAHFFVLGDNRDNSADSRVHGYVPAANITSRVAFIWFSQAEGESLWQVWRLPWSIRWSRLFSRVR